MVRDPPSPLTPELIIICRQLDLSLVGKVRKCAQQWLVFTSYLFSMHSRLYIYVNVHGFMKQFLSQNFTTCTAPASVISVVQLNTADVSHNNPRQQNSLNNSSLIYVHLLFILHHGF